MRSHLSLAAVLLLLAGAADARDPLLLVSLELGDDPMPATAEAEPPTPEPQELPDGASVFMMRCSPCHGPEGLGVPGAIPPLKGSDFLRQDLHRAIRGVLRGLQGPITVNGESYNGAMPSHSHLQDAEIAAALTHVLSLSGVAEPVSAELVAEIRRESSGDTEVAAASCPRMGAGCASRGCAGRGCGAGGGCSAAMPRRHRHGRGW